MNKSSWSEPQISLKRVFGILALAAYLATPSFAAIEITHTGMKDETVSAEYSWVEAGCISRQLTIEASKTRGNDDGSWTSDPVAVINYSVYNFCNPQHRTQAFYHGKSSAFKLIVDPFLRSASLQSSAFPVTETTTDGIGNVLPGRTFNLIISMKWTSTDQIDKVPGIIPTVYPGYLSVSAFFGVYRMANAAGVVSDGMQNWIPSTPDSAFVRIYRLLSGSVTVIRY